MLCIDNEPKILEGMQLLISGWGCDVTCAGSIADMDAALEGAAAPDLVIADIILATAAALAQFSRCVH